MAETQTLQKRIIIEGYQDHRIRLGKEGQLAEGAIFRNPFAGRFELVECVGWRVSALTREKFDNEMSIVRNKYTVERENDIRYLTFDSSERVIISDKDYSECHRKLREAML